jgi:hypothetical protein
MLHRAKFGFLGTALVCAALVAPAFAASLENIEGSVLVNKGGGFVGATQGYVVAAGDRVMTTPTGTTLVRYEDGCVAKVESGRVFTVPATSPCAANGQQVVDQSVAPPADGAEAAAPSVAAPDNTLLIAGGVVAAGGVAAVILSRGKSSSASP